MTDFTLVEKQQLLALLGRVTDLENRIDDVLTEDGDLVSDDPTPGGAPVSITNHASRHEYGGGDPTTIFNEVHSKTGKFYGFENNDYLEISAIGERFTNIVPLTKSILANLPNCSFITFAYLCM